MVFGFLRRNCAYSEPHTPMLDGEAGIAKLHRVQRHKVREKISDKAKRLDDI